MKTTLLMSMAALSIPAVLDAAVLVTQSPDAPTDNLVVAQSVAADNGYSWHRTSTDSFRDIGHSFKSPTDIVLKTITVYLWSYRSAAPGSDFTLRIYETNGVLDNPATGVLQTTQQGTLPGLLGEKEYLSFELEEGVSLAEGKYYTFIFSFDDATLNRQINLGSAPAASFDGYRWYSDQSNDPYARPTGSSGQTKLEFYVQAEAIPEPRATALLMITALGAFGGLAYKKLREPARP